MYFYKNGLWRHNLEYQTKSFQLIEMGFWSSFSKVGHSRSHFCTEPVVFITLQFSGLFFCKLLFQLLLPKRLHFPFRLLNALVAFFFFFLLLFPSDLPNHLNELWRLPVKVFVHHHLDHFCLGFDTFEIHLFEFFSIVKNCQSSSLTCLVLNLDILKALCPAVPYEGLQFGLFVEGSPMTGLDSSIDFLSVDENVPLAEEQKSQNGINDVHS